MPKKKDAVNANGMVDYYKVMPRKFLLQSHNPNFKDHKLNLPFRMLIIGGSGAGKTQTLMNLIRVMNGTFNNIHIITKNKDESLYNYLESKVDTGLSITEGIESAPNLDEFDKKEQSLIEVKMVINIEIEQLTMLISSWSANGSAPTLNEPLNTLKTMVGSSNHCFKCI